MLKIFLGFIGAVKELKIATAVWKILASNCNVCVVLTIIH